MGPLAQVAHWLSQDDLLLKNAVENPLEKDKSLDLKGWCFIGILAKDAVHYLVDLLFKNCKIAAILSSYDPVISVEASVCMIDFKCSASTAQSKLNYIDNNKEAKCISRKRKAESVRKCYYGLRKRICNESFDTINLIFLDESGYVDSGNGHEPTSMDFLLGDQVSNYFRSQELNVGVINHPIVELQVNGVASCADTFFTAAFRTGLNDRCTFSPGQGNQSQNLCPLDDNLSLLGNHNSINEFEPSKELEACNLLESVNLEMLVLSTIDNVSASTLPDVCLDNNQPHAKDELLLLDDFDSHSKNRGGCGIFHSKSELEDQTTCGSMKYLATNAEDNCSDQTRVGDMKDFAPNAEEYFEQ
ncbi:hypothetical protein ACH5RR_035190 [Cinchona calisaya]|uniref:Uncharacterized protein n=1 Tax=Cinchona calisaya TaxID=153742 RepID=A0ABD2YD44_9GENT